MKRKDSPVLVPYPKCENKQKDASTAQEKSSHSLILETYGPNDLAGKPAFQGGYINFGYWKEIASKKETITKEERIKASEALYDLVIEHLGIESKDKILEVGCGRGNGCAKIAKIFNPNLIMGIDMTPAQIERAKTLHLTSKEEDLNLSFHAGSSNYIPFADEHFTKVYSVEAAQCFPSMSNFAQEAWRVLKKGGQLVVTAHFATGEVGYQALRELIPTVDQGVDRLIPIDKVRQAFLQVGFKEINFETIGKHVFERFHQWRLQVGDVKWVDAVFQSYKDDYLDYYLIHLKKEPIDY